MGSKPKQQDYEASDAEKASASVAMAEYQYFKDNYDPLLQKQRDKSMEEDPGVTLRGRANADTMQALTTQPTFQQTQSTDATGDMAKAYQGQLGQANTRATDIQNTTRTAVLGTARGQAADSQTGMGQASRLETSQALALAKGNQQVASAKFDAAGKVAGAALMQGAEQYGYYRREDGRRMVWGHLSRLVGVSLVLLIKTAAQYLASKTDLTTRSSSVKEANYGYASEFKHGTTA